VICNSRLEDNMNLKFGRDYFVSKNGAVSGALHGHADVTLQMSLYVFHVVPEPLDENVAEPTHLPSMLDADIAALERG
jgi:hypothetical protein